MPFKRNHTREFCLTFHALLSAWLIACACNVAYAVVNVNQLVNDSAAAIVQVQGIQWVKIKIPEQYKDISDDVIAIFIVPPDYQTWVERLRRRYASAEEFMQEWQKRRETALSELTRALEVPYYHCIINDDLDRAIAVTSEIARREDDVFNQKDDEARLRARELLEEIQRRQ